MAKTIFKRIIALFLLISLTFGNFAFVGKTYATDFIANLFGGNNNTNDLWNENVGFEAYFEKDDQKSMSVISDVNSYDTDLKLELNVGDVGYLKDASVEILSKDENELNFEISDTRKAIEEVEVSKEENQESTESSENVENSSTQGGESLSLGNEIQVLSIGGQETQMNTGLTLDMSENSNTEATEENEIQPDDSISLIMEDNPQKNTENSQKEEQSPTEQTNTIGNKEGESIIMDLSTPSSEKTENENTDENTNNNEENAEQNDENVENTEENADEKDEEVNIQKILKESSILDEYKDYIDTIEENKISLKQIGSKSNLKISIPIEYKNEDYIDESKLYNQAIVRFTGKYIDEDGKEQNISKDFEINVGWRSLREVKASQEITKYIDFGSGVIIQSKIKLDNTIDEPVNNEENVEPNNEAEGDNQHISLSMDENYLPAKETKLKIQVPKYMDKEVSGVNVSAIKLDATNGSSVGNIEFDENNWNYNPETGEIEIDVKNEKKQVVEERKENEVIEEGNDQKEKIYNIPGEDEYIVTYTYTDVEVPEEGTQIESKVEASQEFYSAFAIDEVRNMALGASNEIDLASATTSTTELSAQVELKDSVGDLISAEGNCETERISKKYAYLNYKNTEKITKEIVTNDIINISSSDIVESIKIKDEKTSYVSDTEDETNDVFYERIELSKSNFKEILGEDGNITIKNSGGDIITVIDKSNIEILSEEDKIQVNLPIVDKIEIVTSKPIKEGMLTIRKVRAIRENTITREKYINVSKLKFEENVSAKYQYVSTDTNVKTIVNEVKLENTKTDANLKIGKNTFATLADNKNIEFIIELKNNEELSDIYGNSHFEIEFPAYITKIELGDVNLSDAAGLEIENARIENRSIIVDLKGMQDRHDVGTYTNGTNIVLYADIDVHDYTPATKDTIKLKFTNSEATGYAEQENDYGKHEYEISYSAPSGLVAVNDIQGYVDGGFVTSVRQGLKEDLIAIHSQVKEATMGITLINNNPNEISNIKILGQFPYEGVSDPITDDDLGATIDTPFVSKITNASTNLQNFKVFYSEEIGVDDDLNDPENGWTENPENMAEVQSYLLVPEDPNYKMKPYELLRFQYNFIIPEDLGRYETMTGTYIVDYKNHTDMGVIDEYACPDVVRITTGEGPEISLDVETEKQRVYEGKEFNVSVTVSNEGRENVKNIKLKATNLNSAEFEKFEADVENAVTLEETDRSKELAFSINTLEILDDITLDLTFRVNSNVDNPSPTIKILFEALADGLDTPVIDESDEITILSSEVSISEEVLGTGNTEKKLRVNEIGEEEEYFIDRYYYEEEEVTFRTTFINFKKEELNNVNISKKINNGYLEYISSSMKEIDTGENNEIRTNDLGSGTYDDNTKEVSYVIGDAPIGKVYYFDVTYKTKVIDNNYDFVEEIIYSKVKSEKLDNEYESDRIGIKIAKTNVIIKQLTEVKNDYIKIGDTIEYKFSVENKGKSIVEGINFQDQIPEELSIKSASYMKKNEKGEYVNYDAVVYDGLTKVTLSLGAEETALVYIDAVARTTSGSLEKTISNKGTITGARIDEESSESVLHIIKADESQLYSDDDEGGFYGDDEDNESGPLTSNNRISGKVWFDENENGVMDGNETINDDMKNISINLLNLDTGKVVKAAKAGVQGEFRFAGLSKGRYAVAYEYDTVKYAITTYKKSNASELSNSDAYAGKISKNGKIVNIAITDEINIENSNVDGVNLGLISALKFDLEVSMGISKISVQTSNNTKTNNYNGATFAKEEIAAKNIKDSKVIIEYEIEVKNTGDIKGFAKKLVDYVPEGMEFNSSYNGNDKWYTTKDGNIYTNALEKTEIGPGESKKLSLILMKNMTEENTGMISNQIEIAEDYNIYGISDIDSTVGNKVQKEDDFAIADVLILIKTGEEFIYTSIIVTILTISMVTGLAVYSKTNHKTKNKWEKLDKQKIRPKGKNYR